MTDKEGRQILDINGEPIPKRAESKVNKERKIITFDYSNSKPIKTLLKHELTHFLETNAGVYRDFLNKVIESDAFKNWLQTSKKTDLKTYRDSVIDKYKVTNGFETAESSQISAEYEMVAEFVEENLFGDGTKMVNEIVKQMNTEQRSKFAQFINKIFEKLKNFFSGKKQLSEIEVLEQEWLKAYKAAEQTWQQQKNTTENSGEQYAIRKGVAKKGKSVYNEYATNVMRWANSAGTNVGDVKIFNDRGKEFVLNEATEDGYIEIVRGSYKEVSGYYEEMRQRADNSFYEYTKQIRAKRDGSMRTVQHNNRIGRHTLRNSGPSGSRGLQTDAAGDNEYLRTGNKRKTTGVITEDGKSELNNSAFSMPTDEEYSLATDNEVLLSMYENGEITREEYLRGIGKTELESVANYTETQYNNFGWLSYNEIVTAKEREILFSRYADYKHNKNKYPTTRFGEAVIHSTECPDVIMYIKGQIRSPQVTKVVRINNNTDWILSEIKEEILANERKRDNFPLKALESFYGQEIFTISKARDYASFRQYITEQKGGNSKSGDTVGRGEQNRGRGTKQNTGNDRAGLNNSAFSMPGDEQYSLATDNEVLLSMYENGEITREEFLKGFNTKSYGLKEITDLNAEDANTLQQVNEVRKETDGDSDSKFWESLQKSKWFDDGLKAEFAKNDKWYHNIIRFARQMISHFKGDKIQEEFYKMERILLKARKEVQKNTPTNTGGRKYSVGNETVTVDMGETERYEILKNKKIQSQGIEVDKDFDIDFKFLEENIKSIVEKPLIKKLRELGYLKNYSTNVIDVNFDLTGGGVRKSLHSQVSDYGGNFVDFAKVILNLQKLLDNSVVLEIHTDKGKGTTKENQRLKQTYVLLSAFNEGTSISPVQFEVKQYVDDSNRLFLAVALTKIETGVMGNTASEKQMRTYLLPVSDISISELFSKINPKDENFLKYVPNQFLNGEQIKAKNRALEKDAIKYSRKNSVTPASEADTIARLAAEGRADEYKTDKTVSKLDAERVVDNIVKLITIYILHKEKIKKY